MTSTHTHTHTQFSYISGWWYDIHRT